MDGAALKGLDGGSAQHWHGSALACELAAALLLLGIASALTILRGCPVVKALATAELLETVTCFLVGLLLSALLRSWDAQISVTTDDAGAHEEELPLCDSTASISAARCQQTTS